MDLLMLQLTNILEPPNLGRVVVTIAILTIAVIYDNRQTKVKREKLLAHQRQIYYKQLTEESLKMEREKLREQLESVKSIEHIKDEGNKIREQLEAQGMKDEYLSLNKNNEYNDTNGYDIENESNHCTNNIERRLKQEHDLLKSKAQELKHVNDDISKIDCTPLEDSNIELRLQSTDDTRRTLENLGQKISHLESENEELKREISDHRDVLAVNGYSVTRDSKLDNNLLDYLEAHDNELTLSFLEKAYETLIEFKASNRGKDLSEYMNELKIKQTNYVTELAEARVAKKAVEIKLESVKKRYEEELAAFDESRIEHLFKNSGAKDFLDSLKETNQLRDEIIKNLRLELEAKKSEAAVWKDKFIEAEKQCNEYWQAWKETQVIKDQLEAEKRSQLDAERRVLSQFMARSSTSSWIQ